MSVLILKDLPHIAESELEDWGPVPEPINSEPSLLRGSILVENSDGSEVGVWTCTPGRWRRKIEDAEMCYFLEGSCSYTDENGQVTDIKAGDMVYFDAMSLGIWDIKEHTRKAYITYKNS